MWELAGAFGGGLPCEQPQAPGGAAGPDKQPGCEKPRRRTGQAELKGGQRAGRWLGWGQDV